MTQVTPDRIWLNRLHGSKPGFSRIWSSHRRKVTPTVPGAHSALPSSGPLLASNRRYRLRSDVPRVFRSERLPLLTADLLICIAATVAIDDRVFNSGFRQTVNVTRRTIDLFEGIEETESIQARLSDSEIAIRAQRVMFMLNISTRAICMMRCWGD